MQKVKKKKKADQWEQPAPQHLAISGCTFLLELKETVENQLKNLKGLHKAP